MRTHRIDLESFNSNWTLTENLEAILDWICQHGVNTSLIHHGSMHAARAALWVDEWDKLFRHFKIHSELSAEELSALKIAAALHDSGRVHDQEDSAEMEEQSAMNCYQVLLALGKPHDFAIVYYNAIVNKDNQIKDSNPKQQYIIDILHDSDCVDIIRVMPVPKFDPKYLRFFESVQQYRRIDPTQASQEWILFKNRVLKLLSYQRDHTAFSDKNLQSQVIISYTQCVIDYEEATSDSTLSQRDWRRDYMAEGATLKTIQSQMEHDLSLEVIRGEFNTDEHPLTYALRLFPIELQKLVRPHGNPNRSVSLFHPGVSLISAVGVIHTLKRERNDFNNVTAYAQDGLTGCYKKRATPRLKDDSGLEEVSAVASLKELIYRVNFGPLKNQIDRLSNHEVCVTINQQTVSAIYCSEMRSTHWSGALLAAHAMQKYIIERVGFNLPIVAIDALAVNQIEISTLTEPQLIQLWEKYIEYLIDNNCIHISPLNIAHAIKDSYLLDAVFGSLNGETLKENYIKLYGVVFWDTISRICRHVIEKRTYFDLPDNFSLNDQQFKVPNRHLAHTSKENYTILLQQCESVLATTHELTLKLIQSKETAYTFGSRSEVEYKSHANFLAHHLIVLLGNHPATNQLETIASQITEFFAAFYAAYNREDPNEPLHLHYQDRKRRQIDGLFTREILITLSSISITSEDKHDTSTKYTIS